jgi:hypothetical protein
LLPVKRISGSLQGLVIAVGQALAVIVKQLPILSQLYFPVVTVKKGDANFVFYPLNDPANGRLRKVQVLRGL